MGCWDVGLTLKVESKDQRRKPPARLNPLPLNLHTKQVKPGTDAARSNGKTGPTGLADLVSLKPPSPGAAQLRIVNV